jgi:hypothetical protein
MNYAPVWTKYGTQLMQMNIFTTIHHNFQITSKLWLSIRSFLNDLFCATYTIWSWLASLK